MKEEKIQERVAKIIQNTINGKNRNEQGIQEQKRKAQGKRRTATKRNKT